MSDERRQAVAGIAPPDSNETVIMQVWPSISSMGLGRLLGGLYAIPVAGPLIALATIPVALLLYFLPPRLLRRYTLTTRRVLIEQGASPRPTQALALEELEAVELCEQPGQKFFRAADLQLMKNGTPALVLPAVPSPQSFRHAILNARDAYVKVMEARRAQQARSSTGPTKPEAEPVESAS